MLIGSDNVTAITFRSSQTGYKTLSIKVSELCFSKIAPDQKNRLLETSSGKTIREPASIQDDGVRITSVLVIVRAFKTTASYP